MREKTPTRTVGVAHQNDFHAYRNQLKTDFNCRCGYCDDRDTPRAYSFEIDHFVPKTLASEREHDYSNLVYSCRTCNNSKRAKWPTRDVTKPNDGKEGWIDPCEIDYAVQFDRLSDGSIKSKTELGAWMWKALTLGNPIHRLKWSLEMLRKELTRTESLDISDVEELKRIKALNACYRRFEEQLRGIPNFG